MFLSVTLGIPYSELGQRISASELTLYQVYYRNHPWGEERADIRNAMQMAQTANMHRGKSQAAYKLDDFMPFREKPETDETVEPAGLRDMFKAMTRKG